MSSMKISLEEELPIILLKEYKRLSCLHDERLDYNQQMNLTNLQFQSENAMLWLDIYQK